MVQRSFLKWVGSKQRIVNQVIKHLPAGNRLIEPFVGAGNVFINANYDSYLISDINQDLMNVYQYIRIDFNELISRVTDIFNGDADYYEMRNQFNFEYMSDLERAAYFIYLNRHCFNGVCRYNKSGSFNVPVGSHKKIYLPIAELKAFAEKLKKSPVSIFAADFSEVILTSKNKDVIYCDPPYLPVSLTANFAGYHQSNFGYAEHEQLAQELYYAVSRGASAVVSNSDCDESRYLFRDFKIHEVKAPRSCAANGNSRGITTEIICVLTPDMVRKKQ